MKIYQLNLALKTSSLSEELHREKWDFSTRLFLPISISGIAGRGAHIKISEKAPLGVLPVKFNEKCRQKKKNQMLSKELQN